MSASQARTPNWALYRHGDHLGRGHLQGIFYFMNMKKTTYDYIDYRERLHSVQTRHIADMFQDTKVCLSIPETYQQARKFRLKDLKSKGLKERPGMTRYRTLKNINYLYKMDYIKMRKDKFCLNKAFMPNSEKNEE